MSRFPAPVSRRIALTLVLASALGSPGTAASAAQPSLGGRFEMHAVVIEEKGLADRSEGTRYTRTMRFRRVGKGPCAWRMSLETVNGHFERNTVCRRGGVYVSRIAFARACPNDNPGRSRGRGVLRFRATRRVMRDRRRYIASVSGSFRASYSGCGGGSASEVWKFSARRTDVPPAPSPPAADFGYEPGDPALTGVRNTVFFADASDDSRDNGRIRRWNWDFGDPASGLANSATSVKSSHTFAVAGNYRVSLTVTDDRGLVDTASHLVYVAP